MKRLALLCHTFPGYTIAALEDTPRGHIKALADVHNELYKKK